LSRLVSNTEREPVRRPYAYSLGFIVHDADSKVDRLSQIVLLPVGEDDHTETGFRKGLHRTQPLRSEIRDINDP
jgi:hypothetical protein